MKSSTLKNSPVQDCVADEIAAYIDGELSSADELAMDEHFAACSSCSAELNSQKDFLRALDESLEHGGLALPANFARTVVVTAETRVSGLRRPGERKKAVLVFAVMAAATMVIVGGDRAAVMGGSGIALDRTAAVLGFASHFVFDIALGIVVVFRSLAGQLVYGSIPASGVFAFAFVVSILGISRFMLRDRQV